MKTVKLVTLALILSLLDCSTSDQIGKIVVIGTQEWMAENLNVSTFRNGDRIPEIRNLEEWKNAGQEGKPAWCYYENDAANGQKYGKLYNWFAVADPRGLAPKGWHVPTDEEWEELEMALGMSQTVVNAKGWRGTDEGTKMKSTSGWNENGNGSNSSGFSALPGALRSFDGIFYLIGYSAPFWSSSAYDSNYVWYRALHHDNSQVRRKLGTKLRGFAVRCVKD